MRFIIQRVNQANVSIKGKESTSSSKIGKGLLVYVGINKNDNEESLDIICDKLLNARLFDDEKEVRWKESVISLELEILIVSNFTLYNNFKGTKPNFNYSMDGANAKILFEKLIQKLKEKYKEEKIKVGEFGEYMLIDSQNDGPVTIDWEYPNEKVEDSKEKNAKKNKNEKNKNNK
jgi:D-tyrosyl-tRNA(Tyr) deacylase